VQDPIHLSERSEPQPDFVLLRPRPDFYARAHPGPADVFLLVEVADTLPSMTASTGARKPRATRSSRQPFHAATDSPPHSSRARSWLPPSIVDAHSFAPALLKRVARGNASATGPVGPVSVRFLMPLR
jgi:hypothetical protein